MKDWLSGLSLTCVALEVKGPLSRCPLHSHRLALATPCSHSLLVACNSPGSLHVPYTSQSTLFPGHSPPFQETGSGRCQASWALKVELASVTSSIFYCPLTQRKEMRKKPPLLDMDGKQWDHRLPFTSLLPQVTTCGSRLFRGVGLGLTVTFLGIVNVSSILL